MIHTQSMAQRREPKAAAAVEPNSTRWKEVSFSEYAWERAALAFLRQRLPDHEPYRAWANFEFLALDGSLNEADVLVLSKKGLFLIEIKSWPDSWLAARWQEDCGS